MLRRDKKDEKRLFSKKNQKINNSQKTPPKLKKNQSKAEISNKKLLIYIVL